MSEPTLYRRGKPTFEEPVHWEWFDELVRAGVLVPVERCEHGNIDGHIVNGYVPVDTEVCLGAGIGDTDVCGAWGGCTLPKGHNMGKVDIPEHHRIGGDE